MNKILLPWSILLAACISAFAATHQVASADDLMELVEHPACASGDTIELLKDIDMAGKNFSPMCPDGFSGFFDGKGKTISNLHISADIKHTKNIAFIAILSTGGELKNLTFDHPRIDVIQSNNGQVSSVSVAVVVGVINGGTVDSKPTVKGNYYKNGEKVIIK